MTRGELLELLDQWTAEESGWGPGHGEEFLSAIEKAGFVILPIEPDEEFLRRFAWSDFATTREDYSWIVARSPFRSTGNV